MQVDSDATVEYPDDLNFEEPSADSQATIEYLASVNLDETLDYHLDNDSYGADLLFRRKTSHS